MGDAGDVGLEPGEGEVEGEEDGGDEVVDLLAHVEGELFLCVFAAGGGGFK